MKAPASPRGQRSTASSSPASRPGPSALGAVLILIFLFGHAVASATTEPRRVPRAHESITVDAALDDPAWAGAMVVDLPFETWPGNNTAASVKTRCLITYDSERLYIAFKAFDSEPDKIRAHLSDRDDAWKDDYVGITLDTFNDQRRAFELFVNPLGVQMDRFNDDVRREKEEAWDAIWQSAGRITEEGYVVEMAIPFYSLRFPATDQAQTWGFEAFRFMPRNQDHQLRSQPRDRDRNCHLCQISQMSGLENLSAGRNLEIVPTLTSSQLESREDFPRGDFAAGDVDVDPGLTVKWGVTPNMILNGTLNPDFSQVEADVAQLDVNTRFALFFPERRPFFLEGADVFKTPINAVFTRNVADPDWGLKLTGKTGRHAIGVFAANDQITNLLLPGNQRSDTTTLEEKSTNAALRYRRDVGSSSAVGALLTSREGGDYSNRVFGFDALFQFKQSNRISFQALGSETTYPEALAATYDQPEGSFSGRFFRVGFSHNSQDWVGWGRIEDVSSDFRADLGFVPEAGQLSIQAGSERIWWGEDDDWYTAYRLGAELNHREDESGQRLEDSAFLWVTLEGPLQSASWITLSKFDRFFAGSEFADNYKIFIHTL